MLSHVDYNMNFNISNIIVNEPEVYPHLVALIIFNLTLLDVFKNLFY